MQINLKIEGKEKTFSASFIKARMFRRALGFQNNFDFNNLSEEDLDKLVSFICELFENQFTIDELWDGLPVEELIPTITKALESVAGKVNEESELGNEKK